MNAFFSLTFVSLLTFSTFAYSIKNPVLSSYQVFPSSDFTMQKIAKKFEVTRKIPGGYEVLVPFDKSQELFELEPHAEPIELDISQSIKNKSRQELIGYHDFSMVQSHLNNLLKTYPQLTSLETYGESLEKRPLLALKVTGPESKNNKPTILLTASTHGDELITVELLFGLLETLLTTYSKDARLSHIVDNFQIYFIPVVNPDGYIRRERYANGVDPNRDYPWPESPAKTSNPCVKAIMDFYASHKIKASIDFHASGEMIMYPWAYTYESLPSFEESFFDQTTQKMASFNGYTHGQISKVIYVAQGSSADYYHWKHHAWSLGIEVGTQKVPPSNQIEKITQENLESTWTFIEAMN